MEIGRKTERESPLKSNGISLSKNQMVRRFTGCSFIIQLYDMRMITVFMKFSYEHFIHMLIRFGCHNNLILELGRKHVKMPRFLVYDFVSPHITSYTRTPALVHSANMITYDSMEHETFFLFIRLKNLD